MNFQQIRDFVNPQIAQATGLQPVDDLQMPVPVAHIVQDLVIDGQLSETSENPVQNKVITHAINEILEQFEGGIEEAVDNWLDDNPQATTTVQDGAITYAKLDSNLKAKADEVTELKSAITYLNNDIIRQNYEWATEYKVGRQLFDVSNGNLVASSYKNGYRVATNYQYPIMLGKGTVLKVPSDMALRYAYSANGTSYTLNDGAWLYGDAIIDLENTGYYVFLMSSYINGAIDTIEITDPCGFASGIAFYYPTLKQIDELNNVVMSFDAWKIGFSHGTIDVQANSWSILDYNNTKRITSDLDHPFWLNSGDVIKCPSGWRMYIAWRDNAGYHTVGSWKTTDYTVTDNGEYGICIGLATDAVLTENINTILSRFEIETSRFVARKSDIKQINDRDAIRHSYFESIARLGYDIESEDTPPQQTIASYKEAYKHGYRIMLADVRWTSDLVPVACHDVSINNVARNPDGTAIASTVNVATSTIAQLDTYDFGIIKGAEYAGTKIMRINDFVALCKKLNCEMYLEIKNLEGTIADISTDKLNALAAVLDKYNIGNKCTFICDNNLQIDKIHAVYPDARIGVPYTNEVGENLTKRINWLLSAKTVKNSVFLYLYDETTMTGKISNDLMAACVENGVGIEYTEIKTNNQLNTWLTDNNNLFCDRVAIRKTPIEYAMIDKLIINPA